MRRRAGIAVAVVVGGAITALQIVAPDAYAGPPWTAVVTAGGSSIAATAPGGSSSTTVGRPLLTDKRSRSFLQATGAPGSSLTLAAPNINRSYPSRTAAWNDVFRVSSATFTKVTSNRGVPMSITAQGLPWLVNATCNTGATSGNATAVTITDIKARLQMVGSQNFVDIGGVVSPTPLTGTSVPVGSDGNVPGANRTTGAARGLYDNSTHQLVITDAVDLVALSSNVGPAGILGGEFKPGDVLDFSATYTLTSSQMTLVTGGGTPC